MSLPQRSGYIGIWILRAVFGCACLLLGLNHLTEGVPAMEAFGGQLGVIGLHAPSALFWGALTAALECLLALLALFGRLFRTACLLLVVPLVLEFAAKIPTGDPRDFLLLTVLMGGCLGLSFTGKGASQSVPPSGPGNEA